MTRKDFLLAVLLAVFSGALVFSTRTAQQTGDSLSYAYEIREGGNLIHPHHLAFLPLLRVLVLTTARNAADPSAAVLTVTQAHGAFWAAIAVASVFIAFRRIGFSPPAALTGAGSLLVAQGFWSLATHASPYVASVACLALAFAMGIGGETNPPSAARLAAASLPWAAAVLFHQANVLYALPLLAGLAVAAPKRTLRLALAATLPAGAIVLAAYSTAYLTTSPVRHGGGILRFVFRYAYAPKPQWGTIRNVDLPGVVLLFRNQLWNLVAVPRALMSLAATLFAVAAVLLIGWHSMRVIRGTGDRALRVFLLIWLVSYWILILWWVPSEKKLFSLTILPIVFLGALACRDLAGSARILAGRRRAALGVAAGIVSAVGAMHFVSVILPTHGTPKGAYLEAQRIERASPGNCVSLADYEVAQSLRYYFGWRQSVPGTAPLIQAYQDRKLDAVLKIRDLPCVVADLDYVRPDQTYFGFDGYREPRRWLRYLGWLLDLERDSAGEVIGGREFDVFATGQAKAYLRIGPGRIRLDGLRGLCARLDQRVAERTGRSDDVFGAWVGRTGTR